MANIIECSICGDEFDLNSSRKKSSGGIKTHCPDCSSEVTIKYAGVQAADGKQSQATILKFTSDIDKEKYISFWKNVSGFYKGKSCQLSKNAMTDPHIKFETVVDFAPTNHKGKSE